MSEITERLLERTQSKLALAQDTISRQAEVLTTFYKKNYILAVVVSKDERFDTDEDGNKRNEKIASWRVMTNVGLFEMPDNPQIKGLRVGSTVKCVQIPGGYAMVEMAEPVSFGRSAIVKNIIDKESVEVEYMSGTKVILSGLFDKLENNCRVLMDEHEVIVLKNLGKDDGKYLFKESTNITWDDIGGQHEAKKEMIAAIELPIKNKELFKAYGKKPAKGILLYGPPGNGKTLIGKAAATSLKILNSSEDSGFIYIKGPEILNMYVGASEERIRSIFNTAREFKRRTGNPAVVFIDEAEAILSKRGGGKSSDIDKTIVPMFLAEMDGLEESAAIVILTTNRPDILDSAVIRDGRIDKKIKVGTPDKDSFSAIFKLSLKKVPIVTNPEDITKKALALTFDPRLGIFEIKTSADRIIKFGFKDIINGAMITAMVTNAVSLAIDRDLSNKSSKPSGITSTDIEDAIMSMYNQNSRMNHQALMDDIFYELEQNNEKVIEIIPFKSTDKKAALIS